MTDKVLLAFLLAGAVLALALLRVFRERPAAAPEIPEPEGPFQCPRCKGEGRIDKPDGKGKDWCPWCRGCGAIAGVPFVYDRIDECKKCNGTGVLRPASRTYPDGSGAPGGEIKVALCPDCRGGLVLREKFQTYRWVVPFPKPEAPQEPPAPSK